MDDHEQDLEVMKEVREATNQHLMMLYTFQAVERWRKIAIQRELDRRTKTIIPE